MRSYTLVSVRASTLMIEVMVIDVTSPYIVALRTLIRFMCSLLIELQKILGE